MAFFVSFQQIGGYFESIECTVAKIRAKTSICRFLNRFYGIPCSIFSTFEVIFKSRYRCQDTCEIVCSPAQKPVLQYSIFYFQHFGGYFESIGVTLHNIRAKTFIRQLQNPFYGVGRSFFSTLEVIKSKSKVPLPRYVENVHSPALKLVLQHWLFYFQHFGNCFQ